ncbi:MAG: pullulanase-type alpha-1,6-glucosidase [Prochlorothrix sp.]|nr:pullulanase-type alpha-1,6-glucosidase [Prochlorothrix sp.]
MKSLSSSFPSLVQLTWVRLITMALLTLVFWGWMMASSLAAEVTPVPPIRWVGSLFPAGQSSTTIGINQSLEVFTQVYQPQVTEETGQGEQVECELFWSEVDEFGGIWKRIQSMSMVYSGDIGNNDEYQGSITDYTGLYEFTTRCTDTRTGQTLWQPDGNGRLVISPLVGRTLDRRALWVEQAHIAWNSKGASSYELHSSVNGELVIPVTSGLGIPLRFDRTLDRDTYAKFPNVAGYDSWYLSSKYWDQIPKILTGEVAIASYDLYGKLVDATTLQLQGVLDDLYSYDGELGVIYEADTPTLKLWAPTAQTVKLWRFADANPNTQPVIEPLSFDRETGVWSITGDPSWDRQYYLYEVEVYVPYSRRVEKNLVTDPYSVNLSENSRRSQIVDLYHDPSLMPSGWSTLAKPLIDSPEDIAIYEVHVRDFSRDDETVAPIDRGKFSAFTYTGQPEHPALSNGMNHLKNLAVAGLTHIHLLPPFDFASVDEDVRERIDPKISTLRSFRADTVEQQAIIGASRWNDSFNWGYDPYHYGVPEGSYATNRNGGTRILEFRQMVQSLNEMGLRVVMDMVYNHTFANGLYTQAVLDQVVPGYYHRYDNNGIPQSASCCADTATEFAMMEKLMIDTLKRWAVAYKVDSFRFDLMNFHTVDNMVKVKDTLQALTLEEDGIDGSQIYIYGEGWDFGSAKDKGLYYAKQYHMGGTGVGTFNDKIRDAIHGGYSQNSTDIHRQGFINGQAYDWNGYFYDRRFRSDLRNSMDRLRIGLAGSLRDYYIQDQNNNWISGQQLNGSGYALDPQESVNYASKHDNETLYDLNVHKLPAGHNGMANTSMDDRVRSQNLALSLIGFSQGVPFFHLGSDMLRSKSLDRNSYDSGDWFNRVDFSYQDNNFGVGLPPAWDNQNLWSEMAPLLRDPNLKPQQPDILKCVSHLQEVLKIRKSSKLFRLETADEIKSRVRFYNTGANQIDALIVMSIDDTVGADLDPNADRLMVFFNADKFDKYITLPEFAKTDMMLHPIQANSDDPVVQSASFRSETGEFKVPARTTAVFVLPQS